MRRRILRPTAFVWSLIVPMSAWAGDPPDPRLQTFGTREGLLAQAVLSGLLVASAAWSWSRRGVASGEEASS